MAHDYNLDDTNNNAATTIITTDTSPRVVPVPVPPVIESATFHDFMGTTMMNNTTTTTLDDDHGGGGDNSKPNLGVKPSSGSSLVTTTTATATHSEVLRLSEVISPSVVSMAASDLACYERLGGNQFEGVPCYGPRSDLSNVELSNQIAVSKRSYSDSAFKGSNRDGMCQTRPDSLENSHLMKAHKKLRCKFSYQQCDSGSLETCVGSQEAGDLLRS